MHTFGMAIGFCVFLLDGLLVLRGAWSRVFRQFPLLYSYIVYSFCVILALYLLYWLDPKLYPSVYWICYLVGILVEFTVLVEISDQIFRPFPALRTLGRALTILISVGLGLFYMLPTILSSVHSSLTLLDFSLRAAVTKAIILVVLFYVARHYNSYLGKNVGGLMLGFSVYVALNIALMASAKFFGSAIYAHTLWVMEPLSAALCVSIWTISLWNVSPLPVTGTRSTATERESESVALELIRFNRELSKILHK